MRKYEHTLKLLENVNDVDLPKLEHLFRSKTNKTIAFLQRETHRSSLPTILHDSENSDTDITLADEMSSESVLVGEDHTLRESFINELIEKNKIVKKLTKTKTRTSFEKSDLYRTRVEIFGLKDTTIRERPTNVRIVKETTITTPASSSSSSNKKANKSLRMQQENSSWLDSLTSDAFDVTEMEREEVVWSRAGSSGLSLQEAFRLRKPDFIQRSNMRLNEIKLRSSERKLENQQTMLTRLHMKQQQQQQQQKRARGAINTVPTKRKQMSAQEMKEQTRRAYEKLPEVKSKKLRQQQEELKMSNRLRHSIYKRAIQEKVLTSGPNFSMDFKALSFEPK